MANYGHSTLLRGSIQCGKFLENISKLLSEGHFCLQNDYQLMYYLNYANLPYFLWLLRNIAWSETQCHSSSWRLSGMLPLHDPYWSAIVVILSWICSKRSTNLHNLHTSTEEHTYNQTATNIMAGMVRDNCSSRQVCIKWADSASNIKPTGYEIVNAMLIHDLCATPIFSVTVE